MDHCGEILLLLRVCRRLRHVRGGCVRDVRFGPYPDKPAPKGDILLPNDPKLRPLGLKVIQIFIHYPKVQ